MTAPLVESRCAEFAQLLNEQGFDLVGVEDCAFFAFAELDDRVEPFKEFGMLAQVFEELGFRLVERLQFFGHAKYK